ncbi:MAG TPA: hypothetical protein VHX88_04135 [Solirubrobacteraceae bacterium]|jgi:threonine dehydrogenase-like Zn-dependent dehydrogenase|nr:hypothetical protein [Solirubrobacteraceae bacterium]
MTSLCRVGGGRVRRVLAMAEHDELDLAAIFTRERPLADLLDAYEACEHGRDGAIKIALPP